MFMLLILTLLCFPLLLVNCDMLNNPFLLTTGFCVFAAGGVTVAGLGAAGFNASFGKEGNGPIDARPPTAG